MPDTNDMLDTLKKTNDNITKALEAATAAQSKNEELKNELGETNSTVQAAVEASTKAMESIQEIKQKQVAIEKAQEYLEKSLSRMSGGDGDEGEEDESTHQEMSAYLRKGDPISDEVIENIVRGLTKKAFHGVDKSRVEAEIKTLIAGNDPQGGYFISPQRSATIIRRIFETSPIRRFANIETTNSDSLEFIIDDDEAASGGWVGEVQARPETGTPQVGKLVIPVHEQYAQPKATQKMIDDPGFDIESWLQGKVTRRMSRVENTSFVSGDGSQKPKGFLAYPNWAAPDQYTRGAIERVNSGAAGALTADGLKELQNQLIEEYQMSAIFGMRRSTFQQVITLKDTTNQYLLDPRSMKVGDTLTLLGKEVVFMHDMPAVANDSLSVVYGDFGVGYTIVDRFGFRVLRDPYTEKPYIKYYTTKRVGGDVTSYEALKIQQLSA